MFLLPSLRTVPCGSSESQSWRTHPSEMLRCALDGRTKAACRPFPTIAKENDHGGQRSSRRRRRQGKGRNQGGRRQVDGRSEASGRGGGRQGERRGKERSWRDKGYHPRRD